MGEETTMEKPKRTMWEQLQDGGFTIKALAFSLPFCILWSYIFVIGTRAGLNTWPTPALMLILMGETVLSKFIGEKFGFTTKEWAVFITIAISGLLTGPILWDAPMAGRRGPDGYWGGNMGGNRWAWLTMCYYMPGVLLENEWPVHAIWFPNDPQILADFAAGGVPVPWGAMMGSAFFWILSNIALYLSIYFIMALFRKPWIGVEKLTFPHTVGQTELVKMVEKDERPWIFNLKVSSGKAFWIGFLVASWIPILRGLNWAMNLGQWSNINNYLNQIRLSPYLGQIFPGYGWNLGTQGWGNWAPFIYFLPLNLIYSFFIPFLLGNFILPAISLATGTAPPGGQWNYGTSQGIFAWNIMFGGANGASGLGGFFFGTTAWLTFRYRKHIIQTIQGAISGASRDPDEPHSYRVLWMGIVGCALLYLLLNIGSGMNPLFVLSYILVIVQILARNRMIAEVGRSPFTWAWYQHAATRSMWGVFGYQVSTTDPSMMGTTMWDTMIYRGDFEFNYAALTSFKYGDALGASSQSVGWAFILATVISFVIGVPLVIGLTFSLGRDYMITGLGEHRYIPLGWGGTGPVPVNFLESTPAEISNQPAYWSYVGAGTVVTFILFWLHANLSWFFFNPIIMCAIGGWGNGWSAAFIVFGLLKWLSLRMGAKFYREVGVPAVTGWIASIATFSCLIYVTAMWSV
jgi:hypothetical protein